MKVTVIDYGLSNLLSVRRALEHCGATVEITSSREAILAAKALCLPGVGAFKDGMDGLKALSLVDVIRLKAEKGTPILGICLGMQMLFDVSEEFGTHEGLGLIHGTVEHIPDTDVNGDAQRVPHVGWGALESSRSFENTVFANVKKGDDVYFVHSYEVKPRHEKHRLANTMYGGRAVCAAAQKGNVIGCQFHPEKSGEVGLSILKQYIAMCEAQA